ncbi:MAG TPA: hypothetical protein VKR30_12335 [Candidatus Limnocylindrales bacterium]|nr:hypothetical protein [Candidatus Limnocylindrales bacterium]
MTTAIRRLPGFAIAIVALAASASLVFAGQPVGSVAGLGTAAGHAGKTVPVQATSGTDGAGQDTQDNQDNQDQSSETETDSGSGDSTNQCTVDLTQDISVLETLPHGSVVCTAAQDTSTHDGYANHGAWVSHWAHLGKGGNAASTKQHGKSGSH